MKNIQFSPPLKRFVLKSEILWIVSLGIVFSSFTASATNNRPSNHYRSLPVHKQILNNLTIKGGVGFVDFYGDVQIHDRLSKPSISGNFSMNKQHGSFFGTGLKVTFGEMSGKRDYYRLPNGNVNPEQPVFEEFQNLFCAVEATGSIHFGSLLKQQMFHAENGSMPSAPIFDPYLFVGFGTIFYSVNVTSTYDPEQNTEIPETTIREFSKMKDFTAPLGAGIKYYASANWNLGVEVSYRFASSDMLDGTYRKIYRSADDFVKDQFSYVAFNFGYTFRYK